MLHQIDVGRPDSLSEPDLTGRHILMIGPGHEQGGVGQFIRYIDALWAQSDKDSSMISLDPRGEIHILVSPFFLALTTIRVLYLAMVGRADLMHLQVTIKGSVARKWFLTKLAKLLRIPVVLHVHAAGFPAFYEKLSPFFQKQTRWLFQNAERCVVLGEGFRDYFVDTIGVSREKSIVVYNGVPSQPKVTLRGDPDPFKLLFVGNLIERKGVPELIEALADPRLNSINWHVTLAGGGDADRYRARAQELGILDRLTFVGWVDSQKVNALIQDADGMVLPSHDEGLPLAVLESLAYGIPVLTTPVGAIPEVLVHGDNGLLVEPGAIDQLAGELFNLMSDGALREKLSVNGHALIRNRLSLEVVADQLADIYADCLAEFERT